MKKFRFDNWLVVFFNLDPLIKVAIGTSLFLIFVVGLFQLKSPPVARPMKKEQWTQKREAPICRFQPSPARPSKRIMAYPVQEQHFYPEYDSQGRILLYANDFEDMGPAGAIYPAKGRGTGLFKDDVTLEAAFYPQYEPRIVTHPDGSKGIRFPTIEETPGGYDYSMQTAYMLLRNRFPRQQRLFLKWVVYFPREYNNDAPSYYYDHRYLFRYYLEGTGGRELISLRFINNREIGFYFNCSEGNSRDDYQTCRRNERLQRSTLKLPSAPAGGQPHEVMLDIELKPGGQIQAAFDGVGHDAIYLPRDFVQGNVLYLVPPRNSLLSDTDLSYFSSIDSVEIYGYPGLLIEEPPPPSTETQQQLLWPGESTTNTAAPIRK